MWYIGHIGILKKKKIYFPKKKKSKKRVWQLKNKVFLVVFTCFMRVVLRNNYTKIKHNM